MFTLKNSTSCASLVIAALLAVVAGNFDCLVNAQTTRATISGTVTDEKGAVVANAKIIAKNLDTNLSRETTSDGAGRYRIPELAAGQYEVTTEAHGFRPRIHRGIELTVGREVVVDLLLNVGNVQDKVIIQGDAALVETTTFDNSSKNKYNPDPTRAVRFGDPTYDEMMVGLVEYTVDGKSVKASTAMNK